MELTLLAVLTFAGKVLVLRHKKKQSKDDPACLQSNARPGFCRNTIIRSTPKQKRERPGEPHSQGSHQMPQLSEVWIVFCLDLTFWCLAAAAKVPRCSCWMHRGRGAKGRKREVISALGL